MIEGGTRTRAKPRRRESSEFLTHIYNRWSLSKLKCNWVCVCVRASACVIHIDRETRSTWWARSMSIIHNDPCEKVEKAHDERGKRIFSKSINTKTAYELVNWAKSDVQLSRHLRAIKSNASVVIEIRITSAKEEQRCNNRMAIWNMRCQMKMLMESFISAHTFIFPLTLMAYLMLTFIVWSVALLHCFIISPSFHMLLHLLLKILFYLMIFPCALINIESTFYCWCCFRLISFWVVVACNDLALAQRSASIIITPSIPIFEITSQG